MPKLTKEVKEAIRKAIEACGGQKEFERKTGIAQQNFSRYLSGGIGNVNERTWRDLEPHLRPYLPTVTEDNSTKGGANSNNLGGKGHKIKQVTMLPPAAPVDPAAREKAIEEFRQGLIDGLIDLEIDPVAQREVLRFVKGFRLTK